MQNDYCICESMSRITNVWVTNDKDTGFLLYFVVMYNFFPPENKPHILLHKDFRI
jgi:hypothetical protein